jgi:hypothetical protein
MKDYGRAVIVGDDHTFGKGTVQSFVHQPGRLGAIKVTTALFFRPGGASTQHEGVAADIVLPSIFATEDLGERYTPYSLASQMIPPFLGSPATLTSSSNPKQAWPKLSDEMVFELQRRSAARVEESAEFTEIKELLTKQAEEDDVVHLAELIRERESAEDDTSDDTNDSEDAADAVDAVDAEGTDETGDAGEGATNGESESGSEDTTSEHSGDEAEAGEDATKPYTEDEPEPTPQREEAIRILADLVELQESVESPWHVPQSASRSELPSSQP